MEKRILIVISLVALAAAFAFSGSAKADEIENGILTVTVYAHGASVPGATYLFDTGTTSATLTIATHQPVVRATAHTAGINFSFPASSSDSAGLAWDSMSDTVPTALDGLNSHASNFALREYADADVGAKRSVNLNTAPLSEFAVTGDSTASISSSSDCRIDDSAVICTSNPGILIAEEGLNNSSSVYTAKGGADSFSSDSTPRARVNADAVRDVHIGVRGFHIDHSHGRYNGPTDPVTAGTGPGSAQCTPIATPEPSSLLLLVIGLLGIPVLRGRIRNP